MTEWTIRALDVATCPAFVDLVEHCDAFPSGCWCMAFHPEGVARGDDHAAVNRERKLARIATGEAHAALVFEDEACVGWCQFGPADEAAEDQESSGL